MIGTPHLTDERNAAWAVMSLTHLQDTPVDVSNRYYGCDNIFGLFDWTGEKPFKSAGAYLAFRWLLDTPERLVVHVPELVESQEVLWSAIAGRDLKGDSVQVLLSNYDSAYTDAHVTVDHLPGGVGRQYHYERYLLDSSNNMEEPVETVDLPFGAMDYSVRFELPQDTVALVRLYTDEAIMPDVE